MDHTREPWQVRPHTETDLLLVERVGGPVLGTIWQLQHVGGVGAMNANARRIVAAVNACQGIEIEALETGIVADALAALELKTKWAKEGKP